MAEQPVVGHLTERASVGASMGSKHHVAPEVAAITDTYVEPWVTTVYSAENTIAVYRRRLNAWIVWCLASDVPPISASTDDVATYRSAVEAQGLSCGVRECGDRS